MAAALPLVLLVIAYLTWIIADIMRSEVQHLPRWGWVAVAVFSIPFGGIVYLLIGRRPD